MIFERENGDGSVTVQVFENTVTFWFDDRQAFRETESGAKVPVPWDVAMNQIKALRMSDERRYRYKSSMTHRDRYTAYAITTAIVTVVAIIFASKFLF